MSGHVSGTGDKWKDIADSELNAAQRSVLRVMGAGDVSPGDRLRTAKQRFSQPGRQRRPWGRGALGAQQGLKVNRRLAGPPTEWSETQWQRRGGDS